MEEKITPAIKDHLRLDLVEPPPVDDQRVPFFGRRRRSGNTWVISLFVVVNLVAFVATMFVNDCPGNSGGGGNCVLRPLGRFSFQPLYENPLLGPSSSTLVKMGAIQHTLTIQQHKNWRLVTCPWLHAGVIHLFLNLSSIIFVGIHLEQEFGPLRVGMIYLLSALVGSLMCTAFIQHIPAVGSSGALFGLLGAALSGLIRNWQIYAAEVSALVLLGFIAAINFSMGFLPHVDSFANIGGLFSGFLLGFVLFFNPQLSMLERKKGIFDYNLKSTVKFKHKLDKPASRIISLLFFSVILAGGLVAVFTGVNASEHCAWCRYINCIPMKLWSCNEKASSCKATVSDGRLTLTCMTGHKFETYPFANVSQERMGDLCSLICS